MTQKSSKHRFRAVVWAICAPAALLAGAAAFLTWGGSLATDAAAWGARAYFSGFGHLSVGFDALGGSLLDGYTLTGLRAGDRENPAAVTAQRVFFALDLKKSWRNRKVAFKASADGVRIDEDSVPKLARAALMEFPQDDPDAAPPEIMSYILPIEVSARDCSGAKGWRIGTLKLAQPEPDRPVCTLDASGAFSGEPVELNARAVLAPTAVPREFSLRARALGGDVSAEASFSGGVLDVTRVSGTLFSSPIEGSARADFSRPDAPLRAGLSLKRADLSPLRRFFPDLGACGFDGLEIRVSGSAEKPDAAVKLDNGRLSYLGYAIDGVGCEVGLGDSKAGFGLSGRFLGAAVSAAGEIGLGGDFPLRVKAGLSRLPLENLAPAVPGLEDMGLEGSLDATADVGGTVFAPKAALSLGCPRLSAMGKYAVTDAVLKAAASAKEIVVENLSARAPKGSLAARGRVGFAGKSPAIDLSGTITGLGLGEFLREDGVKGTLESAFSVSGTADRPRISLEAGITGLDTGHVAARSLKLSANGSETIGVRVEGETTHGTPFSGGGTIGLPVGGRASSLDLRFLLDGIKLAELLSGTMRYDGVFTADVTVKGSFGSPDVEAEMRADEIYANGFTLSRPRLRAAHRGTRVDVEASLVMGDRMPRATGYVDYAGNLKGAFDINADGVRVDAIVPSLSGVVGGRVSLNARATLQNGGVRAEALISSPLVTAAGARASDISVPVVFDNNRVTVSDGTLNVGGCTLHLNAEGGVATGEYTYSLVGTGIDLGELTRTMNLPARIGGSASVSFEGTARAGLTTIVQGDGRLRFDDVAVDKFPGQSGITGSLPFRIRHGNVFLSFNDGTVNVMPGSAITAWPDDRLYHFVSFNGLAWRKEISLPNIDPSLMPPDLADRAGNIYHLYINGSVHARVINGLLSGLGAVLEAGVSGDVSTESIASNVLQKFLGGELARVPREVDADIAGATYGEMRVNKLRFGGEGSYADVATTDWTEDSSSRKDQHRYSLSYPVPVGPDPSKRKPRANPGRKTRSRRRAKNRAQK